MKIAALVIAFVVLFVAGFIELKNARDCYRLAGAVAGLRAEVGDTRGALSGDGCRPSSLIAAPDRVDGSAHAGRRHRLRAPRRSVAESQLPGRERVGLIETSTCAACRSRIEITRRSRREAASFRCVGRGVAGPVARRRPRDLRNGAGRS